VRPASTVFLVRSWPHHARGGRSRHHPDGGWWRPRYPS